MNRLTAVQARLNARPLSQVRADEKLVISLQKLRVKGSGQLWAFGVDQTGYSVALKVRDFKPSLLVPVPEHWPDDQDGLSVEVESFVNEINDTLNEDDDAIEEVIFERLVPFIGFTNGRRDPMMRLICTSIPLGRKVRNHLSGSHKMYHEDYAFTNQFLHQTGLKLQQWIQVSGVRWSSDARSTSCSLEGSCKQAKMAPFEGKVSVAVAPMVKVYMRMKAVSREGLDQPLVKPDATKAGDRIVAIGLDYVWTDSPINRPFYSTVLTWLPADSTVDPLSAAEVKDMRTKDAVKKERLEAAELAKVRKKAWKKKEREPSALSKPVSFDPVEPAPKAYHFCADEKDMLIQVRKQIVAMDPDDLFYFPDQFDTLIYFAQRARLLGAGTALKMDRFKYGKMSLIVRTGQVTSAKLPSRNVFNMEKALQKKVFISVESYDLYTCSTHKQLRKQSEHMDLLLTDPNVVNNSLARGHFGRRRIFRQLLQDMRLVRHLERDMGMRLEFANVCAVSDTDLTDVVSRGEQIRVFNYLTHMCHDNGFYVNRAKTADQPLKFSVSERPPTFSDPDELAMNVDLRKECQAWLHEKVTYHLPKMTEAAKERWTEIRSQQAALMERLFEPDLFEEDEDSKAHAADGEEKEGGNVLKPSCKFWDDMRVFVLDFASLYPSIMRAFNLSYENLVFDRKYLDLPDVKYIYVQVNKYETVASVDQEGLICRMLKTLVDNRSRIKKQMGAEKDPFKKQIKNFEQNSMKVLCNATYGFCGAEKNGAMLAVKSIMYMVTSLGRYLQKDCANYVGEEYGMRTIYGDTDSIFVLVPVDETGSLEQLCLKAAIRYRMDGWFGQQKYEDGSLFSPGRPFTWANVVTHYRSRRKPLDITTFSRRNQINAICYLISEKICLELSDKHRGPIIMELENMADKVWMGWVKKHYCYRFWDEGDPSKIKKIKITGMPVKKREWCPWTRSVLMGVTERILFDRTDEIKSFLEAELDKLVTGEVPIESLKVSKGYKNKAAYKHMRQVHLQVVLKIERRTKAPVKEKSRVFFVVVEGDEKLYMRGETPEYVKKHGLKVDLGFYLKNQFEKPMAKLMTYHPHLFYFARFFRAFKVKLENLQKGYHDVAEMASGSVARTALTREDMVAAAQARGEDMAVARTRRTVQAAVSFKGDPFAQFRQKQTA